MTKSGAVGPVANGADGVSLVSIDSTKQHGVHVFDVNCHICTGSHESTHALCSTNTPPGCQSAVLLKDSDSLLHDISKSDQSPRKKICLAQRLKMYSAELERNSISSASKQGDGECVSEVVSDADETVAQAATLDSTLKQNSGADKIYEPNSDKPRLIMAATEWQVQTVQKLPNESSVEQRNSDQQKLEECSAVMHEEPQKDNATNSHSGRAKQRVDLGTWDSGAPQEAHVKKSHVAGYVAVSFHCF